MRLHALTIIIAVLFPSTLPARQWTDDTGQYSRQAEYLGDRDGQVWLRDAAGRTLVVDVSRLSRADRDYISSQRQPRAAARPTGASGQQATVFKTLEYRQAPRLATTSDASVSRRVNQARTNASVTRLTGWHCRGGHCFVTTAYHHLHQPPPPPPTSLKRIYEGHYSTFHLARRNAGQLGGTGAYKFWVGGVVREYLQMLRYNSSAAGIFVEYAVDSVTPPLGIDYWWFEDSFVGNWHYRVYYHTPATGYVLYDHARRRIPE